MKMQSWLIYSILAIILWGVWGLFGKLATNYIPSTSVKIIDTIGFIIVAVILLYITKFQLPTNKIGITYAILGGVAAATAGLFFYLALKQGKLAVVASLTAIYPAVTVLLSYLILKEQITLVQGIGIILAIIATLLLSL